MNIYKASYCDNRVYNCSYICSSASDYSSYYYEYEDDVLVFAIIKAETLPGAYAIAEDIAVEASQKVLVIVCGD